MKVYFDIIDKLNGQNIIQQALKENTCNVVDYPDDADILVYAQFDDKKYEYIKNIDKLVIFCHHYSASSVFSNTYVIKNNYLDVIDYHIILSKDSELYDYLLYKGVDDRQIIELDFATIDYNDIFVNDTSKRIYDLIFVGRYDKGFDAFINYIQTYDVNNVIALCPDAYKSQKQYNFTVITNAKNETVLEYLKQSKFLWSYSTYNSPKKHLELTMHEAIACGCVNLVDNMYDHVLSTTDVTQYGFSKTLRISEEFRNVLAIRAKELQKTYLSRRQMCKKFEDILVQIYKNKFTS